MEIGLKTTTERKNNMAKKTADLPLGDAAGVTPKKIQAIEKACAKWRKIVQDKNDLKESEKEAKEEVIAQMHAAGVSVYRYYIDDDHLKHLVIKVNETVKLVEPKDGSDDSDEEDEKDSD